MNKKILSLAVAAAVAAPMAAMADVTVNGAVSRDIYSDSATAASLNGGDAGTSKLEINVKEGDAFAKVAFDIRPAAFTGGAMPAREQFAGVKLGGVNVSVGRLASAYAGTLKVDTMTANFLESRNRAGGVSKVPSFQSGMIGIGGSAGDVKYQVNYGVADTTNNRAEVGVSFKAGPATVGVAYHSDSSGETSTGLAAKMKFGDIAVGVSYENADGFWTSNGSTGNKQSIIFADVAMPVGGGTVGLGIGSNTTDSVTFTRLSYQQNIGKATVTAGYSSADGDTRTGLGLKVGF